MYHFKSVVDQCFALESQGLVVMGVSVNVHTVTVLDGKCYELAFGKFVCNCHTRSTIAT
mgnify:CR=1 FL=1